MVPAIVAVAVLAVPGTAAAHARGRTPALDYLLRVPAAPLPGVRAEILDGDRELRLHVAPGMRLVVRGLVGEPVVRFGADGVWANRASPTAAADKLVKSGTGWTRLSRGRTLTWHDHRLAPPRGIPAGRTAPFALPVTLNGSAATIRGSFEHVPRPGLWPWLLGAVVAVGALAVAARTKRRRIALAAVSAMAAALGALAQSTGLAAAGGLGGAGAWLEAGNAAALALVAAIVLLRSGPVTRAWTATVAGAVAAALSLGSLGVFWHGVVISALSPVAARLATAAAIVGGCAAAVLGVLAGESKMVRR
jgi:hypothetical protein